LFFAKIVGSLATSSNFVNQMKQRALEVFEIFEKVHGPVSAKTIVEYLENTDSMAIQREISARIAQLATKNDVTDVKSDIALLKNDVALLNKDISSLKDDVALRTEMAGLRTDFRAELKAEISCLKADLIKTFVVMNMAQLLAIVVSLLAIIKFFLK